MKMESIYYSEKCRNCKWYRKHNDSICLDCFNCVATDTYDSPDRFAYISHNPGDIFVDDNDKQHRCLKRPEAIDSEEGLPKCSLEGTEYCARLNCYGRYYRLVEE